MLAYHLVFWNENALARLRGEKPASPGNNDETFNDFDAARWDEIVQRLDRVMKDLEAAVEKMPDEKLALKAPLITHISTHNAYHTGQILYVRKLLVPGIRRTASTSRSDQFESQKPEMKSGREENRKGCVRLIARMKTPSFLLS